MSEAKQLGISSGGGGGDETRLGNEKPDYSHCDIHNGADRITGTPAKDNPSSAWPSIEDVEPEYQAEYADCVNKIQDIVKKSRDFRLRQRYEEEMVLKMSKASSDAQRLEAKLKTAMNEDQAAGERCARIEEICLAAEQLVASSTASLAAAKEVAAEAETARHAAQAKRRATKVKVKEIKERKRKADKHVHRLKRQRCEDYTDHNKEELTDNLHPPGVVMQATGAREDLQAQVQGPVQGPAAEAAKAPAAPMPSLSLMEVLAFLAPDETAGDLLSRLHRERLVTGLPFLDQHLPGMLLEVCGPTGSGKSEVLIQVVVNLLLQGALPSSQAPAPAASPAAPPACSPAPEVTLGSVVLLDLDARFEPLRLLQVLKHRLLLGVPGPPPGPAPDPSWQQQCDASRQALEQSCLARLHVLRPHSSLQLLALLHGLPELLGRCQVAGAPCRVLMLDGVTAFSLQERAARAVGYQGSALPGWPPDPPDPGGCGPPPPAPSSPSTYQRPRGSAALAQHKVHTGMAQQLQRLSTQWRLALMATKAATVVQEVVQAGPAGEGLAAWPAAAAAPPGSGVLQLSQQERMPAPWQGLVTHRLLLLGPNQAVVKVPAQVAAGAADRSAVGREAGAPQYWEEIDVTLVVAQLFQGLVPHSSVMELHIVGEEVTSRELAG
ncbi:hypothetical protein QJQ45_003969 [Haematococcus lacustris]|nr:hypothetical protein QJQ45_003969 [Haematococcus lacustris]